MLFLTFGLYYDVLFSQSVINDCSVKVLCRSLSFVVSGEAADKSSGLYPSFGTFPASSAHESPVRLYDV